MKKFKIKPFIVLVLVGVLMFSLYNLFLIYKQNADEQKALNSIKNVIDTKETTITAGDITIPKLSLQTITKDDLARMKEVNSDVIGYLEFDSGLISEPVVQLLIP